MDNGVPLTDSGNIFLNVATYSHDAEVVGCRFYAVGREAEIEP